MGMMAETHSHDSTNQRKNQKQSHDIKNKNSTNILSFGPSLDPKSTDKQKIYLHITPWNPGYFVSDSTSSPLVKGGPWLPLFLRAQRHQFSSTHSPRHLYGFIRSQGSPQLSALGSGYLLKLYSSLIRPPF